MALSDTPTEHSQRACTFWCRLFLYQVIGDSRCAVFHIDDATAAESVFLRQMLHGFVVRMGIYTQVGTFIPAKFHRSEQLNAARVSAAREG